MISNILNIAPIFLPVIWLLGYLASYYLLILLGFSLLDIKHIPRQKITIFILVLFLLSSFLNPFIISVFAEQSKVVLYFINFFVSSVVVILFIKYHFKLIGKNIWQFYLYLVTISFIFSQIISIVIKLSKI